MHRTVFLLSVTIVQKMFIYYVTKIGYCMFVNLIEFQIETAITAHICPEDIKNSYEQFVYKYAKTWTYHEPGLNVCKKKLY